MYTRNILWHCVLLEVVSKLLASARVSQLAKCLCLDLTNPLSGYSKDLPTSSRVLGLPSSKPNLYSRTFASPRCQCAKRLPELLNEHLVRSRIDRCRRVLILDEVAETAVLLFSDRCLERDSVLCDALDLTHLVYIHIDFSSQFSYCRLSAKDLRQFSAVLFDLVDRLNHMHSTDSPCLIRNSPDICCLIHQVAHVENLKPLR